MSIKPNAMTTFVVPTLEALRIAGVVRLSGRDAAAFAQSQFANDLRSLEDGQWHWNLWLSPKGRVLALFALLRINAQDFLAILPDASPAWFAQELLRFRFRSKLEIAPLETCVTRGGFLAPAELGSDALGERAAIERDEAGNWLRIVLDLSGAAPRSLVLETGVALPADDAFQAHWTLEDIAHGLPRLSESQVDAYTPQMLGLDRLSAFSVNKGCYPGQEIVARTHFLGKTKRGLLRLAVDRVVEAGTSMQSADGANAEIVSVASDGERIEALAVAPLDAAGASFHDKETGASTTPLALLEGLAR
jgi:folate-binding protein YgfZ